MCVCVRVRIGTHVKTDFLLEKPKFRSLSQNYRKHKKILYRSGRKTPSRHVQLSYLTVALQFNISDIVTALVFNWLMLQTTYWMTMYKSDNLILVFHEPVH